MKKIFYKTFLFSVFFLLSACSSFQTLDVNREIEHVIVDNGDVLCEYVKGIRINCYNKNEGEKNETQKI